MKRKKNKMKLMQEIVGNEFDVKKIVQDNKKNKISQVIIDFASPLLKECVDDQQFEKAIALAVFLWNLCLISKEEQKIKIQEMLDACGENLAQKIYWNNLINDFIQRKKQYFSHENRFIVNYRIINNNGQRNLMVAAMPGNVL